VTSLTRKQIQEQHKSPLNVGLQHLKEQGIQRGKGSFIRKFTAECKVRQKVGDTSPTSHRNINLPNNLNVVQLTGNQNDHFLTEEAKESDPNVCTAM
jgi:hypothetical protein